MKTRKWLSVCALCCLGFVASSMLSYGQNNNHDRTRERPDDTRLYNPATVETIRGEVTSVEEMPPQKDRQRGIHLRVKTSKENIPVHLGPPAFMADQNIQIREGDQLEITGSRVTMNGQPAMIARTVKSGLNTLMLRDENGVPVWSRARPGKPEPQ